MGAALHIQAPDEATQAEAIYALAAEEWDLDLAANCRQGRIHGSHYDWATARIGLIGEEVVTHVGVYALTLRIGTARVPAAGVNLVVTHPAYRGQRYMQATLDATHAAMRAAGYSLSILCNATDGYYPQFGYRAAWGETLYEIARRDLPILPLDLELHPFIPGAEAVRDALFNAENATLTGTVLRPTYPHSKTPGDAEGTSWQDADGTLSGYIVYSYSAERGILWHEDSAGDPALRLGALRHAARQHECPTVRFPRLPPRSRLAQGLRQLPGGLEVDYRPTGGWMVKVIHLPALCDQLTGEWSRRLAGSALAGWRGTLRIAANDAAVTLEMRRGTVRVVAPRRTRHTISVGPELAQLALGTFDPAEITAGAGTGLTGDAAALLAVLFPAQEPQMGNADL